MLQEYFKGSIFVDNTSEGILSGIKELGFNYKQYNNNTIILKNTVKNEWNNRYDNIIKIINKL